MFEGGKAEKTKTCVKKSVDESAVTGPSTLRGVGEGGKPRKVLPRITKVEEGTFLPPVVCRKMQSALSKGLDEGRFLEECDYRSGLREIR